MHQKHDFENLKSQLKDYNVGRFWDSPTIPTNKHWSKSWFYHGLRSTPLFRASWWKIFKFCEIRIGWRKKNQYPSLYQSKILKLRYFNFEPSFKVWWGRAWDLFESQILVTTGEFELRISCIRSIYLTH